MQTEYAVRLEDGRSVFAFEKSPMCDYMINFIHKLNTLPNKALQNSVLDNFTILQVCAGCARMVEWYISCSPLMHTFYPHFERFERWHWVDL